MPILWNPVELVGDVEAEDEPLGTKLKFWVVNPDDDRPWLLKFARVTDEGTLGEDWAEWVVHQVGGLLTVPTADIRPATLTGRRAILSRSVVDSVAVERLVHGNSLLAENDADYDATLKRENPRYTVDAVHKALDGVAAPAEFVGDSAMSGFDVWAGFLMLDALVGGRDRHHENWGVISSQAGRSLAPSYDHGNALGFQEREPHLERLNQDQGRRSTWLSRGRSHHFAGRPGLVELAHAALRCASPKAREYWNERLRSVSQADFSAIVQAVPREIMSDPAHTFALYILTENRERLLRDYPDS